MERTPMSELEKGLVEKLQRSVTFPPATSYKRFVRDLSPTSQLSDRGRMYLGFIAHRFRRQWTPTAEEAEWVRTHQFSV